MAKTLPPAYYIAVGGTAEESQQSQASVTAVVPLMLLIMITILISQLQSFQRLLIALSVAPLGLIGVVGELLVSGRPLGPRHSRLDRHDHEERGHWPDLNPRERRASQSARPPSMQAARGSAPIVLTAISMILGMIPIAPTLFWGPMAFAIMGGLRVATVLTQIFVPTLYVTWFERSELTPAKTAGSAA